MSKALCKSKKTRKDAKRYSLAQVPDATHVCRKCGRFANSKKKLCKAKKLALAGFVDVIDERPRAGHRGLRHDAVTEIEDVAGAAGRAREHLGSAGPQHVRGGKQRRGVEVALDADVGAEA